MTPRDLYTVGKPTVGSIQWHACTRSGTQELPKTTAPKRTFFSAAASAEGAQSVGGTAPPELPEARGQAV